MAYGGGDSLDYDTLMDLDEDFARDQDPLLSHYDPNFGSAANRPARPDWTPPPMTERQARLFFHFNNIDHPSYYGQYDQNEASYVDQQQIDESDDDHVNDPGAVAPENNDSGAGPSSAGENVIDVTGDDSSDKSTNAVEVCYHRLSEPNV